MSGFLLRNLKMNKKLQQLHSCCFVLVGINVVSPLALFDDLEPVLFLTVMFSCFPVRQSRELLGFDSLAPPPILDLMKIYENSKMEEFSKETNWISRNTLKSMEEIGKISAK